jgi:hypothetical protein
MNLTRTQQHLADYLEKIDIKEISEIKACAKDLRFAQHEFFLGKKDTGILALEKALSVGKLIQDHVYELLKIVIYFKKLNEKEINKEHSLERKAELRKILKPVADLNSIEKNGFYNIRWCEKEIALVITKAKETDKNVLVSKNISKIVLGLKHLFNIEEEQKNIVHKLQPFLKPRTKVTR